MRFTLYTEKTVAQCLSALNARMQAKGSAARPALDGWVEKNGRFALSVSTRMLNRFSRTTHLTGQLERRRSVTIVTGRVNDGAGPRERMLVSAALGLAAVVLIALGELVPALIAALAAAALNLLLAGDRQNRDILIAEVRRALKARETPPAVARKPTEAGKTSPAARKSTSAAKPTATARRTPAAKSNRKPAASAPKATPAVKTEARKPAASSSQPKPEAAAGGTVPLFTEDFDQG